MIEPLRKGDPYPGRRPKLRDQWRDLAAPTRWAVVGVPSLAVGLLLALNLAAGTAAGVLVLGAGAATATYVKNRTDRHNAAIDRGELRVPDDPHLKVVDPSTLADGMLNRLEAVGYCGPELGLVKRFDGGVIVRRRNPRDIAVVLGDDGGVAFFDPRWVPDLLAATEYMAGRGREPA